MATVIPSDFRTSLPNPCGMRDLLSALENALDDEVTVWFERPTDPARKKPAISILFPDAGVLGIESFDEEGNRFLGIVGGKARVLRGGKECDQALPLFDPWASGLRAALEAKLGRTVPVQIMAVFPSLSSAGLDGLDPAGVLPREGCLFTEHIFNGPAGGASVRRRLRNWLNGVLNPSLSAPEVDLVRVLLHPETDLKTLHKPGQQLTIFRGTDSDDVLAALDQQQENLAKSLGSGHRVIRGVAGSGKTLILVHRALHLSRQWEYFPTKRILVSCYTKTLAGELRRQLDKHKGRVLVDHLDHLMASVIRAAGGKLTKLKTPKDRDDRAIAARAALEKSDTRFDAVLLDEAQDFGTEALRFAVALLKPDCDELLVVADSAQNIFRQKFTWKDAAVSAQGRTKILVTNYRNTREVVEFAQNVLRGDPGIRFDADPGDDLDVVIPPKATPRSGPAPDVITAKDEDESARLTVSRASALIAASPGPRRVALIHQGGTSNDATLEALRRELDSQAVRFFEVSNLVKNSKNGLNLALQPAVLTTVHSAKGLEFPHVFVVGKWNDAAGQPLRRLLYVAMTRAVETLTIVAIEGDRLVEVLKASQVNIAGTSATAAIPTP